MIKFVVPNGIRFDGIEGDEYTVQRLEAFSLIYANEVKKQRVSN
jgi:hypothetical protein